MRRLLHIAPLFLFFLGQAATAVAAEPGASIWETARWSPYVCGAGIGVLTWIAFGLSDRGIGASTAYARSAGMIEETLRGPQVEERAYWRKYAPKIEWQWVFVASIVVGAFISAALSGSLDMEMVPELWLASFGDFAFLRWLTALCGGVLIGIGARWADGCTSGHGISGTLQLMTASWIALICFFAGGAIMAQIIYP